MWKVYTLIDRHPFDDRFRFRTYRKRKSTKFSQINLFEHDLFAWYLTISTMYTIFFQFDWVNKSWAGIFLLSAPLLPEKLLISVVHLRVRNSNLDSLLSNTLGNTVLVLIAQEWRVSEWKWITVMTSAIVSCLERAKHDTREK